MDEFEVYGDSSLNNEIEIFSGNVENLSFSDTRGIGIRVFKNNRMGYAYSSNLTEEAIDDCIKKAIENSSFTAEDEYNSLPKSNEFLYPENTDRQKKIVLR